MGKGRMGEHDVLHDYEIESWGGGATQKTKRDIGGRAIPTCRFVAWTEEAVVGVDGP